MEKDNFTNIFTCSFKNSKTYIQYQTNVEETNLFAIFWGNVRLYCRPFFWSTDRRIDLSHAKDWPRHENIFKDANMLLFIFSNNFDILYLNYLSWIFSRPAEGPLPSRMGIPKRKVVSTKTERTACKINFTFNASVIIISSFSGIMNLIIITAIMKV